VVSLPDSSGGICVRGLTKGLALAFGNSPPKVHRGAFSGQRQGWTPGSTLHMRV